MKKFFKKYWKFLLFVLIGSLIGGYFGGIWLYGTLSEEYLIQLQEQNITRVLFIIIMIIQYGIIYGALLAGFGVFFSEKVNLWKEFKFEKKAVITTLIITIIGALVLFPGDKLIFGSFSSFVKEQYVVAPDYASIIAGVLLGGIVEEVMMRLFLMSIFVFIFSQFLKNKKEIPVKFYIIANIICALLFAVGHIPSTMAMTTLTPLLVVRCLLFNGTLGLGFGYLYRKYGIGYAMIAHGFAHLIADILMIIFI